MLTIHFYMKLNNMIVKIWYIVNISCFNISSSYVQIDFSFLKAISLRNQSWLDISNFFIIMYIRRYNYSKNVNSSCQNEHNDSFLARTNVRLKYYDWMSNKINLKIYCTWNERRNEYCLLIQPLLLVTIKRYYIFVFSLDCT